MRIYIGNSLQSKLNRPINSLGVRICKSSCLELMAIDDVSFPFLWPQNIAAVVKMLPTR